MPKQSEKPARKNTYPIFSGPSIGDVVRSLINYGNGGGIVTFVTDERDHSHFGVYVKSIERVDSEGHNDKWLIRGKVATLKNSSSNTIGRSVRIKFNSETGTGNLQFTKS